MRGCRHRPFHPGQIEPVFPKNRSDDSRPEVFGATSFESAKPVSTGRRYRNRTAKTPPPLPCFVLAASFRIANGPARAQKF